MNSQMAKNESDYIERYTRLGYVESYRFIDNRLRATNSKETYTPEQVNIVKEHRFEGMSNPSDLSLLFVLETTDGKKGTLLSAYGPQADLGLHEFLGRVPDENIKDLDILSSVSDENSN